MKRLSRVFAVMVALAFCLALAVSVSAQQGPGPGGKGGKHERIDVLSGNPVTVAGTVSEAGRGLQIDTGGEVVAIYGIGPSRYWEEAGIERPDVGDAVSVDGYEVTFSDGSVKIIAASVTVGGTAVQLIDEETGKPLWRKARGSDGEKPERVDILTGDPVTVAGVVSEIGGKGVKIDTGSEILTVYGIGPRKYWEDQEAEAPEVGDNITVDGYEVTFNDGIARIIAMSATVNGTTVQLRDTETGKPLWPKRRPA